MDKIRDDLLMQVVQRNGRVLLLFSRRHEGSGNLIPEKTDHMMLNPEAAISAAECITSMAFEADTNLKPVGDTLKASLVQKHRDILIPRIAMILNSQREKKTVSNKQLAVMLMDVFCSEVFS